MNIKFPNKNGEAKTQIIEASESIVIVGANGSGKSRLGYEISRLNQPNSFRISAQRTLLLPTTLPDRWALDRSEKELKNRSNISVINQQYDYDIVLQMVFGEKIKRDSEYVARSKGNRLEGQLPVPDSVIEIIDKIWKEILPQRKIEFADDKVEVKFKTSIYSGTEMSDGERVALYLIGKCLIVPRNTILIIDEPELHLHKSLMSSLWNKIEEARNDCRFIYITHDLDFASSRTKTKKIWAKSYESNNRWIWEEIPEIEEIPENLLLEIIGSRKPILFIEGDKGSYDYEIYQHVFPDYTLIPRGNSEKVIESTKALRSNTHLHRVEAHGLIDRDYKEEEELECLRNAGIIFTKVAEVENLLCCSEILKIVAQNQALNNFDEVVMKVTDFVIGQLKDDFEKEVSFRSSLEINFKLNAFNQKAVGKENLKTEITNLAKSIDVDKIYAKNQKLYKKIIDDKDLESALKNYTNKGLLPNMSHLLGLGNNEYPKLILRLLKTDKKSEIVIALKNHILEIKKYPQ